MRRVPRHRLAILTLSLSAVAIGLASAADPSASPALPTPAVSLDDVLSHFDRVQSEIRTLSAHFTETTVNQLLKEPMVAGGHFYMTKPDSVMWQYSSPETMQFVIADNEYVGYFPSQKRAERRDIQRWRDEVFRFFGLGQVSSELRKVYNIRLDRSEGAEFLLVLDPKKSRVQKRMQAVRFWVDRESYLPVRVEYEDKSGNTRVLVFDEIRVNPKLSASLYRIDIPSDVTVTTGFAGLQALGTGR